MACRPTIAIDSASYIISYFGRTDQTRANALWPPLTGPRRLSSSGSTHSSGVIAPRSVSPVCVKAPQAWGRGAALTPIFAFPSQVRLLKVCGQLPSGKRKRNMKKQLLDARKRVRDADVLRQKEVELAREEMENR